MSDSTPPRLSARLKKRKRCAKSSARDCGPLSTNETMPPKPCHLPLGERMLRMRGQTGIVDTRSTSGCASRNSATAWAFCACWRIRSASVLAPRIVRQASCGPGTPPDRVLVERDRIGDGIVMS